MLKQGRQQDLLRFRERHSVFSYLKFEHHLHKDVLMVRYHFFDGIHDFYPEYIIPVLKDFPAIHGRLLDNILFHIGLCELISYWKSSCAPVVKIYSFTLDEKAQRWWKKLFYYGLGEFRYLNRIECTEQEFVRFEFALKQQPEVSTVSGLHGILVPVGGGKDSAVTLEVLQQASEEVTPFVLNGIPASFRTIKQAGIDPARSICVERKLDGTLLELNGKGYLNGHTPFSALLAFVSSAAALLNGKQYVALSNEASANEATIPGTDINHQYSKSLEFEKDFRFYYGEYVSPSIEYFSFLRPLTERLIAGIFATLPQHHLTFRSCNRGSKTDSWCGSCSKCLFVWIILSPFLTPLQLRKIFGKDLGDDLSLLEDFKKLSGLSAEKPFECVGTVGEVRQAVIEAYHRGHGENKLYRYFMENIPSGTETDPEMKDTTVISHYLPEPFFSILKSRLP